MDIGCFDEVVHSFSAVSWESVGAPHSSLGKVSGAEQQESCHTQKGFMPLLFQKEARGREKEGVEKKKSVSQPSHP